MELSDLMRYHVESDKKASKDEQLLADKLWALFIAKCGQEQNISGQVTFQNYLSCVSRGEFHATSQEAIDKHMLVCVALSK